MTSPNPQLLKVGIPSSRQATWPEQFRPNLTPRYCIQSGIFGGSYFNRRDLIQAENYPTNWFEGLDSKLDYERNKPDPSLNRYGVKAGTSQADWERSGWMHADDPRGWFQWYCNYYLGRRHEDDKRQIDRWVNFASVSKGRWSHRLYLAIERKAASLPSYADKSFTDLSGVDDETISPVIRQSLLHWGYEVNIADYLIWRSALSLNSTLNKR